MLDPHNTNENGSASFRSGGSMPPCGHAGDDARRNRYDAMRMAKIVASVAISVAMPHHAAGLLDATAARGTTAVVTVIGRPPPYAMPRGGRCRRRGQGRAPRSR